MADTDFSKFVPGFDFLQGLMKNAGAAIPGFNQWVAPTLDPAELDKRIDELRTVQFWLENNARLLSATIQSLEVQRMTLSTLHAMNVPMADLKEALKSKVPPAAPAASAASAASTAAEPPSAPSASAGEDKRTGPSAEKPAGADPLQWWNALTQQFTQVAANAMKTAQTAATAATTAATAASTSAPDKAAARSAAKSAAKSAAPAKPRPAAKKAAPARRPAAKRKTT